MENSCKDKMQGELSWAVPHRARNLWHRMHCCTHCYSFCMMADQRRRTRNKKPSQTSGGFRRCRIPQRMGYSEERLPPLWHAGSREGNQNRPSVHEGVMDTEATKTKTATTKGARLTTSPFQTFHHPRASPHPTPSSRKQWFPQLYRNNKTCWKGYGWPVCTISSQKEHRMSHCCRSKKADKELRSQHGGSCVIERCTNWRKMSQSKHEAQAGNREEKGNAPTHRLNHTFLHVM